MVIRDSQLKVSAGCACLIGLIVFSLILIDSNVVLSDTIQPEFTKLGIKGSFVVAAICKDGIIIASDSRGNIFDKTNKEQTPIAYFDIIQKIFPVGRNAIAETGQGLILNVFFSAIIKDFSSNASNVQIDQLLSEFINYCERQLPSEGVRQIKKQKLFAAGYINDSPTICYFNEDQPEGRFGCIQNEGLIESAPTILSQYKKQMKSMTFNQAAILAKKAIQTYAKKNERWKTIGGPINVLLITENGSKWIENEPPLQRWTYIQELVKEYNEGKFKVKLIPPTTKQEFDNLMATVPDRK